MTKVAAQRAVRLVHVNSQLLSLRIVGLANVDGDFAILMTRIDSLTGHRPPDSRGGREVRLKIEREGQCDAIFGAAIRKLQQVQQIEQAALGHLEPIPFLTISRNSEVGDDFRETARIAQGIGRLFRDGRAKAIADVFHRVIAAFDERCSTLCAAAMQRVFAVRNQWRDFPAYGTPPDLSITGETTAVLEK